MKYTIPAFCFRLFRLSQDLVERENNPNFDHESLNFEDSKEDTSEMQLKYVKLDQNKVFKLFHELVNLIQSTYPEVSLRLYLQACQAMNRIANKGDVYIFNYL